MKLQVGPPDKEEWKSGHKKTFFPNDSRSGIIKSGWKSSKYSDSHNRAKSEIWIYKNKKRSEKYVHRNAFRFFIF